MPSRLRVSAMTVSALPSGRGQRRMPCGVSCAPCLAWRETSFINVPTLMPFPCSLGAEWSFSEKVMNNMSRMAWILPAWPGAPGRPAIASRAAFVALFSVRLLSAARPEKLSEAVCGAWPWRPASGGREGAPKRLGALRFAMAEARAWPCCGVLARVGRPREPVEPSRDEEAVVEGAPDALVPGT